MTIQLRRTILIVEDSPADCEMYRRYLMGDRDYDYTILEASLGEAGLHLWRQHQPDAVLLDYRLPDLDGLEFLAALQTQESQTPLPIVMITGVGSEAIAVQAIKAGAQDYLVKGQITPESLTLALEATIKTVQLQTQLQECIDRERVIAQIAQKVFRSLNLDEILHTTVTEVRQFLQTDRVVVFQVEPDGNGRVVAESVGADWRSILADQIYDPCFAESYVDLQRQGRVTVQADIYDGSIDPCHVQLLAECQVKANLVVPILHDDQFWGVLIAHSCAAPRQWQSLEIDLLQQLSTQVSVAIRQAELYQQAQAELAERKRTEEVLRGSEERLRLGLQAARMGTWDWNILENQIIWSANMEDLFGLAPGEFDGSYDQFVARLHPDDRDRVLDAVDAAITTGANYDLEFRVVYPNGTIRWALSQGKVFYDATGRPVRMSGVDLDISDRKQTEATLRDNEELLRLAMSSAQAGSWDWDIPIGKVVWSAENYVLYGLDPTNGLPSYADWDNALHPDDRDRANADIHRVLDQRLPEFQSEFRIIHPQLGVRWLLGLGRVTFNQQGEPVRLSGINLDISDRKTVELTLQASEQRYRALIGITTDIVWNTDADGMKVTSNWGTFTGQSIEEFQGWGWSEAIHPDDRQRPRELWSLAVANLTPYENEHRLRRWDGEYRLMSARAVPLLNADGSVREWVGLHTDITEARQAEEELRQAHALAQCQLVEIEAIYQTAPIGLGVLDVDLRFGRINQRLAEINGIAIANHVGHTLREIIPDLADEVETLMRRVLETGEPLLNLEINGETIAQPGIYRTWIANYYPLKDGTGRSVGINTVVQEITDRKQSEKALQESEARFRQLAENIDAVFWLREEPEGRVAYVSSAYERLWGWQPQELYENHSFWVNHIHPDDREWTSQAFQAKAAAGQFDEEYRIVLDDGKIRWVHDRCFPLYDHTGRLYRFAGIAEDVSDRIQAKAALQQSEEFKNLVLESSSDCIKVLNLNAQLLYMNAGGMCMLEIDDLTPYLNSEWLCFWEGERQAAEAAFTAAKSGEVGKFQGFCATVKGKPKWWDVVVTPMRDGAGQVVQILSTSRDITERKRTEEELRQKNAILDVINDSAPTPIFVKNRQGQIIYANPATLAALGKTAAEVIGFYDSDLYPSPEDAAKVMENDQRIMASGQMEVVEETPDGIHIFLGMKAPYYNEAGEVIGLIGVSNDITDRVQLERDRERILQQKQAALAESERVNRIKDEFLAVLSHELRSPLNPILGWTKLLQTRKLDETKTVEALVIIERNAKAQCQLIDDLLDMARVLRGKLTLNVAPVNLRRAIEAAIDTVQTAAIAKSIQIHPILSDIRPVSGDAVRLQQIVWNLLTNAVKFTPSGGRVTIRLEQIDHQAQITVTDTGRGIHPDFLPHIFESFRQEDASVTRKHGGLGLGMAIVYQLVEAHGGTVTADSPGEGQGATFTVKLPLLNVNSTENQSSPLPAQNLDLTGIRVLIIDDEPDSRELLAVILAQARAEAMTVASAAEFLNALESFQPDVVVSDIGMPEIDGYTLLRQVRFLFPEQGGQVPAIALTAYAGEIDRQQAIAAGFQRHITKPIEPDQLVVAIAELGTRINNQR